MRLAGIVEWVRSVMRIGGSTTNMQRVSLTCIARHSRLAKPPQVKNRILRRLVIAPSIGTLERTYSTEFRLRLPSRRRHTQRGSNQRSLPSSMQRNSKFFVPYSPVGPASMCLYQ